VRPLVHLKGLLEREHMCQNHQVLAGRRCLFILPRLKQRRSSERCFTYQFIGDSVHVSWRARSLAHRRRGIVI